MYDQCFTIAYKEMNSNMTTLTNWRNISKHWRCFIRVNKEKHCGDRQLSIILDTVIVTRKITGVGIVILFITFAVFIEHLAQYIWGTQLSWVTSALRELFKIIQVCWLTGKGSRLSRQHANKQPAGCNVVREMSYSSR